VIGRRTKLIGAILKLALGILLILSFAMAVPLSAESAVLTGSFTVQLTTSNVSASDISVSQATIFWETNGNATSQVFYDTLYHDNIVNYARHSDIDGTLVSHHLIYLGELSRSTTYHYRVTSKAVVGSEELTVVSPDYTFVTSSGDSGNGGIMPTSMSIPTSTPTPSPSSIPLPTTSPSPSVSFLPIPIPEPTSTFKPSHGSTLTSFIDRGDIITVVVIVVVLITLIISFALVLIRRIRPGGKSK
jgi:hypothetical protein